MAGNLRLGGLRLIFGVLEKIVMPRRLVRYSLALVLLLSSQAFALGLGEIRVNSALNEPLRADVELLAASPEEIADLKVALASDATFERYGLDRPYYLNEIRFEVVRSGRGDGNSIRITSQTPITEPFLTFLVEATWSSGRLLREYTVLLDPPTFAPPQASQPAPVVTAPERAEPADSGRIERTPVARPAPEPEPEAPPQPVRPAATTTPAPIVDEPVAAEPVAPAPEPLPAAVAEEPPAVDPATFSQTPGGDLVVARGDTLWGIASRMRPDSRLTMNQTMLAIYEANPEAFGGNMNFLRAGASLRMPSADDIFRIDRGDAFREAERQHAEWDSNYQPAQVATPEPEPAPVEVEPEASLTLVPPDEDLTAVDTGLDSVADAEPLTREQEILDRIAEIEAEDVPADRGLIEIRDNELANLRRELADIRGEVYEPPVDDMVPTDDELFVDDETGEASMADDELFPDFAEETADDEAEVERPAPTPVRSAPSLVDQIIGYLTSIYAIIGAAVLVAVGVLLWFLRRRGGDDDPENWQPLEAGDPSLGDFDDSGTESLRAPDRDDDAFVVEEQEPVISATDVTVETPAIAAAAPADSDPTGQFDSLEDTFSSETAVNLDQSDPIAEADFHMAYGLYDQAADLINGAIDADPGRQDLLSKLCEIYFVWGNRDAFVDAATRLKTAVGGSESAEWDKIVIMGQQIAGDHELFAGAGTAAATKEMDLSFDADESDGTGALDMEFGDDSGDDGVIDLGAETQQVGAADDNVDFLFDDVDSSSNDSNVIDMDLEATADSPTLESSLEPSITQQMPSVESTAESPTLELGAGSELPSLDDTDTVLSMDSSVTAEIDLDDLGLDMGDLDASGASEALSDTGINEALSDTGINEALTEEIGDITGKNPEVDPDATGVQVGLGDIDATGLGEALDVDDVLSRTGTLNLAPDETGVNPMVMPADEATDADINLDDDLLAATGKTQVLPEDFAVQTAAGDDVKLSDDDATMLAASPAGQTIGDEDATLLAGLDDDDEGDFDFAKTEALPADAFTGSGSDIEQTGELPVASTDVDLDLDDLTAALKVSAGGDTVDMPGSDATVEQPRPDMDDPASTMSLGPEDMSDDLDDARTMTEVGTKLDLARAYVDMGDPGGARSILEEVLDEGDEGQRQQAQSLLDSLPA